MRKGWWVFIGAAVLAVAGIFYWLMPPMAESGINWRETFDPESREPYGTAVLYQLLDQYYPELSVEALNTSPAAALADLPDTTHYTYFYVGAEWFLSEQSRKAIHQFLQQGHDVVVVAAFVDEYWYEGLPLYYCQPDYWLSEITLREAQPRWIPDTTSIASFYYQSGPDTLARPYRHFTLENTDCDSLNRYRALSFLNFPDAINAIRFPYYDGEVMHHLNPILFTNYALRDSLLLQNAERLFAQVQPGMLLWDTYTLENAPQQDPMQTTQSPLSFILAQPALRWAWWTLLVAALLFVLFRGKRQQRIIPVIQSPANQSLRFVETIGRLHYQQRDHSSIAEKQYHYWLLYCRQQYQEYPRHSDAASLERLAEKREAPLKLIREIAYLGEQLPHRNKISTDDLLHFHRLIQDFYHYK